MSHHASGPNFGFPRGDARLDMTDLYAFTKSGDTTKSVIVLNVHPSFKLDSPEPTTSEPFKPGALYEFKIDTYSDAVADICYSVQFASSDNGSTCAISSSISFLTSAAIWIHTEMPDAKMLSSRLPRVERKAGAQRNRCR